MAAIAVQHLAFAGTAPVLTGTVTASDTLNYGAGDRTTFAVYTNTSGSPVTVTITPFGPTSYGVAKPALVVTVPASGKAWVPLIRDYDDGNGSNTATVTTAGFASLNVALVSVQ